MSRQFPGFLLSLEKKKWISGREAFTDLKDAGEENAFQEENCGFRCLKLKYHISTEHPCRTTSK